MPAVAEARRLMNGKNDREVDLNLADIYEKAKNFTEMAKVLDAAEALSQSSQEKQDVAFRRGAMYERMKNYPAAEAEFRKVLDDESGQRRRAELSRLYAGGPQRPAGRSSRHDRQSRVALSPTAARTWTAWDGSISA